MDVDKKIRLSVEPGDIRTGMQEIRDSLFQEARKVVDDIRSKTSSQEEFNKALEREISLRERINKTSLAESRLEFSNAMFSARSEQDREEARQQYDDVISQSKVEDEQLDVLKQIRELLNKQDRESDTETVFNDREDKYGTRGSSDTSTREERDRRDYRRLSASTIALGLTRSFTGAETPVDMGLGVASSTGSAMVGFGGGVAAAGIGILIGAEVAKKGWSLATEYAKQWGESYATLGREASLGDRRANEALGFSKIDMLSRLAPLAMSRRSGVGIEESLRNMLLLKKGINLDENLYSSMEMMSTISGQTGLSNIQSAIAAMRAGGIVRGQDMSAVPDFLSIIVQQGKEQLSRLGRIDVGVNSKMVSSLASMDDVLSKSPEALSSLLNGLQGGLTGAKSPQMEALQYSVLSRMYPGASYFELRKMREAGFRTPGYAEGMIELLKNITGGGENLYLNLEGAMGISASQAEILGKGYGKMGQMMKQEFKGKVGVSDLEARAIAATPTQEELRAKFVDLQTDAVRGFNRATSNFVTAITKFMNWVDSKNSKIIK